MNKYLQFSKEVQQALEKNLPIVALESTIISHGMPYPQNVQMANEVENIIRAQGAVPATIALMNGKIMVGLEPEELEILATSKNVSKVSRRDMASVLATRQLGATTVAATMICAKLAGINFFVTGGIGGVHRGYEQHMDVSADLDELAMTDVTVICAGAKSILDLPRTLEYLETKGVMVVGYKTDELPAFYTAESGIKLNQSIEDLDTLARLIQVKKELGLNQGVLVVNPIPKEHQLDKSYIDTIIEQALQDAEQNHISGKAVTPFLLAKIVEKTQGKSLLANIQLVYNNARVGAKLAVAYHHLNQSCGCECE